MFVIVDIEWIDNMRGLRSPTQLAAVRVDTRWNETDRFDMFILPKKGEKRDYSHIACKGFTKSDELYAQTAYATFANFQGWLGENDILLFWHEEAAAVYSSLYASMFGKTQTHKIICLNRFVYCHLRKSPDCGLSAYKLAEKQKLPVNNKLMHRSIYDADVTRQLVKAIDMPQMWVMAHLSDKELSAPPVSFPIKADNFPYIYDRRTNTIHRSDCPHIAGRNTEITGYPTLRTALTKRYKPCECCRKEYSDALRERNISICERSSFSFIYSPDSGVFHKYTCGLMHHAKNILGCGRYDAALAAGRVPCKVCRPTADDDLKNPAASQAAKSAHISKSINSLTKEERQAVKRQQESRADRARMLSGAKQTDRSLSDIYTLTQPRFAFWASRGYRTFHKHGCRKLNDLSDLRGFATYNEALRAGYKPCRSCKPSAKQNVEMSVPFFSKKVRNDSVDDMERLCAYAGYRYSRDGQYFNTETPVGRWRVDTKSYPIRIEHINLIMTPTALEYHQQPRLFLSFGDVFRYIKRHDTSLLRKARYKEQEKMPCDEDITA